MSSERQPCVNCSTFPLPPQTPPPAERSTSVGGPMADTFVQEIRESAAMAGGEYNSFQMACFFSFSVIVVLYAYSEMLQHKAGGPSPVPSSLVPCQGNASRVGACGADLYYYESVPPRHSEARGSLATLLTLQLSKTACIKIQLELE